MHRIVSNYLRNPQTNPLTFAEELRDEFQSVQVDALKYGIKDASTAAEVLQDVPMSETKLKGAGEYVDLDWTMMANENLRGGGSAMSLAFGGIGTKLIVNNAACDDSKLVNLKAKRARLGSE